MGRHGAWRWVFVAATLLAEGGLPAGGANTATVTHTLSMSLTQTGTFSESITLPTATDTLTGTSTLSKTITLPTGTESATDTFTETLSDSLTATESLSISLSKTDTFVYYNNYSFEFSSVSFVEGQEFRVMISSMFDASFLSAFNVTAQGTVQARLFEYSSSLKLVCADYVADPGNHPPLASTDTFGMTLSDGEAGNRYVGHAHVTFTAPRSGISFIVCFKHNLADGSPHTRDSKLDTWMLAEGPTPDANVINTPIAVFSSDKATKWYKLTEPTASQYAIIQLLAVGEEEFTYPSTDCGAKLDIMPDLYPCGFGDNLKIVPADTPCTYEHQNFDAPYFGSGLVELDGSWNLSALPGLLEGATAGGVGRFGTQYANPLVDKWSSPGGYHSANKLHGTAYSLGYHHHAYVYARLPSDVGKGYDVCYSSLQERQRVANVTAGVGRNTNATVMDSRPVWRKLFRCSNPDDCGAGGGSRTTRFTVTEEEVKWSAVDLSPMSWGHIRFQDTFSADLNTNPAQSPVRGGTSAVVDGVTTYFVTDCTTCTDPTPPLTGMNYYWQRGGDMFRIVPASSFTESVSYRASPNDNPSLGSFASKGCWDTTLDSVQSGVGGMATDDAIKPLASTDLMGDPLNTASKDDDGSVTEAFSPLYFPQESTQWYVCYRKASTSNAGFRVLPWQGSTIPDKWQMLGTLYSPRAGPSPHLFIPSYYGDEVGAVYPPAEVHPPPPEVVWYMNDTRAMSFGPLSVEMSNTTELSKLDRRRWTANSTGTPVVRLAVGSQVRLVPNTMGCNNKGFDPGPMEGVHSSDGGGVECQDSGALTDVARCNGSTSDSPEAHSVSFFVTVPPVLSVGYRVCFRQGAWNWVQLSPTPNAYRRESWIPESGVANLFPSENPVDLGQLTLLNLEKRGGMEALFVIQDSLSGARAAALTPTGTGDLLRVVPHGDTCDLNPQAWRRDPRGSDLHLSLYCKKDGVGLLATSGLASVTEPCGYSASARDTYCHGWPCPTALTNYTTPLERMVRQTPDVYDDIPPFDQDYSNHGGVAAAIVLPWNASVPFYKICYKQAGLANWLIFNDSFVIEPPPRFSLVAPLKSQVLLSGELQRFSLRYSKPVGRSEIPGAVSPNITQFTAKLVRRGPFSNDNCFNPPAGTEADAMASVTQKHRMGESDHHVEFRIIIPHSVGDHWLCIQAQFSPEDALSWYRHPHPVRVVDNRVRWYVSRGAEPMNQGVNFVEAHRCEPSASTQPGGKPRCDPAASKEVFDTSPGKDALKIVPTDHACHGGKLRFQESEDHGLSWHVALEGVVGKAGAKGVDDLGPADGPADTAITRVTPPAPPGNTDDPVAYKLCVKTTFLIDGARRVTWVEAQQAEKVPNQASLVDAFRMPAFVTRPSLVSHWSLGPSLRPGVVLVEPHILRDPQHSSAVGLGGATTTFVSDHDTASPGTTDFSGGWGFNFTKYSTGSRAAFGNQAGNTFKLVQAMRALARYPPNAMNGSGWTWESVAGAACDVSPAVDSATNMVTCNAAASSNGECPSISNALTDSIRAKFVLPIDPGAYMVCYRIAEGLPWVWLRSGESGSPYLFTQPSYLEFDASDVRNISVFDLRMASSLDGYEAAPVSSWCTVDQVEGNGVPCFTQNSAGDPTQVSGFFTDLISVVPDVQICTRPQAPTSYLSPPTGWHSLIRVGNSTTKIWNTWGILLSGAFNLPTTGRYKLCLYKAGTPMFGLSTDRIPDNGTVANAGVMYQLYNRQVELGYFTGSLQVTGFTLGFLDTYNTTRRFTEYSSTTRLLYENTDPTLLTEPNGHVSYTPVYRSGVTLGLTVSASTSEGPVPFGRYAVWIERCKSPRSWLDLSCTTAYTDFQGGLADFLLENTMGSCSGAQAAVYGWPTSGLRQFLSSGTVSFRLQYRSACTRDVSDNQFGCGIRVAGIPTGQQVPVYSNPLWVNIANQYPDEVQVDSVEVLSGIGPIQPERAFGCSDTNPDCYQKTCYHAEPCVIHIQARHQGPVEYAAKGSFSMQYSVQDYVVWRGLPTPVALAFLPGSWKEQVGQAWLRGGNFDYTNTPMLVASHESATVFFNISYGLDNFLNPQGKDQWVRVAVKVVRREPVEIRLLDVAPMDLRGLAGVSTKRSPVDVWHAENRNDTFPIPSKLLTAMPGSYIESLVPYELTYQVCVDNAQPCAHLPGDNRSPLGSWTLSGSVVGQTRNKVLQAWFTQDAAGVPTFTEDNLRTSPAYASNVVKGMNPNTMTSGTTFRLWFRMLNNIGCSRFNVPPGCAIEFLFERGSTKLRATLQTPVRVVAQTLRIEGVRGAALTPVAPITDGITVTALPGTPMDDLWLADEFHYGDVFTFIDSPGPSDGVSNRDGTSVLRDTSVGIFSGNSTASCNQYDERGGCIVWRYATRQLGNTWGAQWLLRTTKPCHNCAFTFHSTWGATPLLSGGVDYGTASLTFTDDTASLVCTLSAAAVASGVSMPPGSTLSESFSVTVAPQNNNGVNVPWPRWWVFTDLKKDATVRGLPLSDPLLRHKVLVRQVLSSRMQPLPDGSTAAAFDQLVFQGTPPSDTETQVDVVFHSIGQTYNPQYPGSIVKGSVGRSCRVTVNLKSAAVKPPPSFMRIVSVEGASPMCAVADGCTKWYGTTDTTTLLVKVWVYQKAPTANGKISQDLTERNLTVRNPADSPSPVTWNCVSRSAPCTTEALKLPSPYPDWTGKGDGDADPVATYSYGAPSVRFIRARDSRGISAAEGKGLITISQLGTPATRAPVRAANLSVCATLLGSSDLVDNPDGWFLGDPCVALTLWIVPPTSASINTAIVNVVGNSVLEPGTLECGRQATPLSFYSLAYYAIQGDSRRYVVYEKPLRFSITTPVVGAQSSNVLVEGQNPVSTDTVVSVSNAVPPRGSLSDALLSGYEERGFVTLYGLEERAAAVQLQITTTNMRSPNEAINKLDTTRAYRWTRSTMTPYSVWEVLDEVQFDDECPQKRKFSVTDQNFRSYSKVPGQGWSYVRHGAVAGMAFPVQTIVKTSTINGASVTPSERAWTFQSSLVTASKQTWSGCNEGGFLIVHKMSPSKRLGGAVLLPTSLDSAFQTPSIPDTVRTNQGVATVWLELTEPCESCTVELNLCYTTATSVKDCFADPEGDLNQSPPFAERTKLTKPFTVRKPQADKVHVLEQSKPKLAADGSISVGETFTTSFETVQSFSKWSLPVPGSKSRVWVASKWVHQNRGDATKPNVVRYGSGGFISAGLASKGVRCGVQPEDMVAASRRGASLSNQADLIKFFFTRPCSACEVWYYYEIDGPDGKLLHSGSFPQRQVTSVSGEVVIGSVLTFHIRTCGELWLLAGVPPVAVQRRRPFSLTAWRVDTNHNPAWTGSDLASIAVDDAASQGNGGGGAMHVSSPSSPGTRDTPAVNGTATVRMAFSRACYSCAVRFAVKIHEFTVLTQATQLLLIPLNASTTQLLTAAASRARWNFEVYAADDFGDRAFSAGGPTPLAWRALYSGQAVRKALGISAKLLPYNAKDVTSMMFNSRRTDFSLKTPAPALQVLTGGVMYDGIPQDEQALDALASGGTPQHTEAPGLISFEVSGDPSPAFRPQLLYDGIELPVRTVEGLLPPVLRWTVPPTRFVTTLPTIATVKQGDVLPVTVFALGKKPGEELLNTTYHLSTADPAGGGGVTLTVDCGRECPDCRILLPRPESVNATSVSHFAAFANGMAEFQIRIRSNGGRESAACDLRVTSDAPEFAAADPQRSTLSVLPVSLVKWTFVSSNDLSVTQQPTDIVAHASAAYNTSVDVVLQAWDAFFNPKSWVVGVSGPFNNIAFDLDPPGCFVCETDGCPTQVLGDNAKSIPPYGSQLGMRGYFTVASNSTVCTILGVSGLPGPTEAPQTLRVSVQSPEMLRVLPWVPGSGVGVYNFSNLQGRTGFGAAAMVAGHPAVIRIEIADAQRKRVEGDHFTKVALSGMRDWGAGGVEFLTTESTARNGVAEFLLSSLAPTVLPDCSLDSNSTQLGPCPHYNWTFSAAALLGVQRKRVELLDIGPLYVVRRSNRLQIDINTLNPMDPDYDVSWQPLGERTPGLSGEGSAMAFPWVWGYPFYLRVTAADSYSPGDCAGYRISQQCQIHAGCSWFNQTSCVGTPLPQQPLDREDPGFSAMVLMKPAAIPCDMFDVNPSVKTQGCTAEGMCEYSRLPACGMNGYISKGTTLSQQQELLLSQGGDTMGPLEYVGRDGADGRTSRITFASHDLFTPAAGLPPRVFSATLLFQKIAGFTVVGSACAGGVCMLPEGVFRPINRYLNPLKPEEVTVFKRAAVYTPFNLSIAVVDRFGKLLVGDSVTRLRIQVGCVFGDRAFSAGVLSGLTNEVISRPPGWDTQRVVRGAAVFTDIGFRGLCSNASILILCNTSSETDPHGTCAATRMRTEYFEVGDSSAAEPTPVPTPVPVDTSGLPRLVVGIGPVELAAFGNAEKAKFEASVRTDFIRESGRELHVYLRYACSLSVENAQVGITIQDKADPNICKQWGRPAGAAERDAAVLNSAVCVSGCTSVVEFEVNVTSQKGANDNLDPVWQDRLSTFAETMLTSNHSDFRTSFPEADTKVTLVKVYAPTTEAPPSGGPVVETPVPTVFNQTTRAPRTRSPSTPQPSVFVPLAGARLSPSLALTALCLMLWPLCC